MTFSANQIHRLSAWKRLLYSFIVVTALVAIPEAALRWTSVGRALFPKAFKDHYEGTTDGMFRMLTSDPVMYWRGRPFARVSGTEEFLNNRGFRGNTFSNQKPSGMRRIVCMGDSSTFGLVFHGNSKFTYSPTYSSELQALLNKNQNVQTVQVINAGVIGYSTLQGLRLLKHEVRHWEPDVITIRYGTNDHLRIDPNYVPSLEPRNPIVRWLEDRLLETHSYQFLIRLKNSVPRGSAATAPQPSASPSPSKPAPVPVRVPLPDFEYNLQRMVIEGRATGAEVVLITAPVAPPFQEITSNRAKLFVMGYSSYADLVAVHKRYEDAVRRVAEDLDVTLLDSSLLLEQRGLEKFFTKFDFAHPTGDGHVAIAQDLAALIESEQLLRSEARHTRTNDTKRLLTDMVPSIVGWTSACNRQPGEIVFLPSVGMEVKGPYISEPQGALAFWGNGSVRQAVALAPGAVTISIVARGNTVDTEPPRLRVALGGRNVGTISVTSNVLRTYAVPAVVESCGLTDLEISFDNYLTQSPRLQSRHVVIEMVTLQQPD